MPIRFGCKECQARIRVPDGSQGKKVKCPKCGTSQYVPAQSEEAPESSEVAPAPSSGNASPAANVRERSASPEVPPPEDLSPEVSSRKAPEPSAAPALAESTKPTEVSSSPVPAAPVLSEANSSPHVSVSTPESPEASEEEVNPLAELAAAVGGAQKAAPADSTSVLAEPDSPNRPTATPSTVPAAAEPETTSSPEPQPVTRPVPHPQPMPVPIPAPVAGSAPRPSPASPRAIPLSAQGSVHRPTARPIPLSDQPPLSAARASVGPAPDYLLLLLGAYGLPILAGINLLWTVFLVFYRIAQLGRQASLLPVFEALFTGVCLSVLLAGVGLGLGALRDHLRRSHRG